MPIDPYSYAMGFLWGVNVVVAICLIITIWRDTK